MRTLVFIVNGEYVSVCCEDDAPLVVPMHRALRLSHNLGRPFDEWEIRLESGERLDDFLILPSDKLKVFLTIGIGCGGNSTRAA